MDMPLNAHSTAKLTHSKVSKPNLAAYQGNTVTTGTVDSKNMMIAGQFSGGRLGETSADIDYSGEGTTGPILSGPAADFRVIMGQCEPPGIPVGGPGEFRDCPS